MAIKVLHVGLGPIGAAIVRQVLGRTGLSVTAAVDADPAKVGRDLGDVCGLGRRLKMRVSGDLIGTIRAFRPDVAILCTGSSMGAVLTEFETVLKLKVPIVSTTEELVHPVRANTAAAKKIDKLARRARVAVLGTGVNPGFAMDVLPIVLTAACENVRAISVDRVQDARIRRLPFQQKIGAGLTPEEFVIRAKEGSVRHVGLAESISMIAEAVGWRLDRISDEIQPKIADEPVSSDRITVEAGHVAGIVQDGVGWRRGQRLISLHMEAYLGAPESYDAVRIDGTPALQMKLAGGVHGDIATASLVVNSIPRVLEAEPGLRTMRELPIPSFFRGR